MGDSGAALGLFAGVLSLLAFIPYVVSILRGQTRPNRATWWVWTVCNGILFASYFAAGERRSAWVPMSYTASSLLVAILSLKRGEGGLSRFDRGCALSSAVGLVLWGVSGSPLTALAINIGVDFAGALPTLRKTYLDPKSENLSAWALFLAANLVNLFAVEAWASPSVALPIYYFLITLVVFALAARRPPQGPIAKD
ncbi:MAG: hypothetical protein HUU21_26100 [Polyangiaceae bacterium]|nr:hypothetical protein [Polyangiaceae bacterium]NUQ77022.1 hypothetical protein [Polyangiaceae bacterium]